MVKKERCVLCGCETEVSESLPIEFRSEYVEGVGQLCPNCFRHTFRDQGDKNQKRKNRNNKQKGKGKRSFCVRLSLIL